MKGIKPTTHNLSNTLESTPSPSSEETRLPDTTNLQDNYTGWSMLPEDERREMATRVLRGLIDLHTARDPSRLGNNPRVTQDYQLPAEVVEYLANLKSPIPLKIVLSRAWLFVHYAASSVEDAIDRALKTPIEEDDIGPNGPHGEENISLIDPAETLDDSLQNKLYALGDVLFTLDFSQHHLPFCTLLYYMLQDTAPEERATILHSRYFRELARLQNRNEVLIHNFLRVPTDVNTLLEELNAYQIPVLDFFMALALSTSNNRFSEAYQQHYREVSQDAFSSNLTRFPLATFLKKYPNPKITAANPLDMHIFDLPDFEDTFLTRGAKFVPDEVDVQTVQETLHRIGELITENLETTQDRNRLSLPLNDSTLPEPTSLWANLLMCGTDVVELTIATNNYTDDGSINYAVETVGYISNMFDGISGEFEIDRIYRQNRNSDDGAVSSISPVANRNNFSNCTDSQATNYSIILDQCAGLIVQCIFQAQTENANIIGLSNNLKFHLNLRTHEMYLKLDKTEKNAE